MKLKQEKGITLWRWERLGEETEAAAALREKEAAEEPRSTAEAERLVRRCMVSRRFERCDMCMEMNEGVENELSWERGLLRRKKSRVFR